MGVWTPLLGSLELYLLGEDPHEQHDAEPSRGPQLEARLQQLATQASAILAHQRRHPPVAPNQETLERLRALGLPAMSGGTPC